MPAGRSRRRWCCPPAQIACRFASCNRSDFVFGRLIRCGRLRTSSWATNKARKRNQTNCYPRGTTRCVCDMRNLVGFNCHTISFPQNVFLIPSQFKIFRKRAKASRPAVSGAVGIGGRMTSGDKKVVDSHFATGNCRRRIQIESAECPRHDRTGGRQYHLDWTVCRSAVRSTNGGQWAWRRGKDSQGLRGSKKTKSAAPSLSRSPTLTPRPVRAC